MLMLATIPDIQLTILSLEDSRACKFVQLQWKILRKVKRETERDGSLFFILAYAVCLSFSTCDDFYWREIDCNEKSISSNFFIKKRGVIYFNTGPDLRQFLLLYIYIYLAEYAIFNDSWSVQEVMIHSTEGCCFLSQTQKRMSTYSKARVLLANFVLFFSDIIVNTKLENTWAVRTC